MLKKQKESDSDNVSSKNGIEFDNFAHLMTIYAFV